MKDKRMSSESRKNQTVWLEAVVTRAMKAKALSGYTFEQVTEMAEKLVKNEEIYRPMGEITAAGIIEYKFSK